MRRLGIVNKWCSETNVHILPSLFHYTLQSKMLLIKQKITFYKVNFSPCYLHVQCKVYFKLINKLGEEGTIMRQERDIPFSILQYALLQLSLLIKALELPVPLSDPFAETF